MALLTSPLSWYTSGVRKSKLLEEAGKGLVHMVARMNYGKAAPGAMRAMNGLETYIANCGLEPALKELVRVRASQIN